MLKDLFTVVVGPVVVGVIIELIKRWLDLRQLLRLPLLFEDTTDCGLYRGPSFIMPSLFAFSH
ncbi:type I toxin-antitoxin system Fst family toxin [Lacticaseibacillus paracasei]|nr:type I toxin-antitoxin system Fst family toxin [Lacticaseibacillus paracasei]